MISPDSAPARVILFRPRAAWRDRARKYKLLIDGEEVCTIRHGQELTIEVTPGRHVAQARISWTGSTPVSFDAAPGQTVRLTVRPATADTTLQQAVSVGYLLLERG